MPNWCSGNIRFKGKMEDILKLIKERFIFCKLVWDRDKKTMSTEQKPPEVKLEGDYEIEVSSPFDDTATTNKSYCWIKGTSRNFINDMDQSFVSSIIYDMKNDKNEYIVVFDSYKAAWSIEPEPYMEMSRVYHVDIRVIGWEQGMGFWQDIVVVDGKLIRNIADDYGGYDGWMWESALPYLGG